MNIEEQLNREIERAHDSGDLNLESTLMLARHTIRMNERSLDIKEEKLKDLRQQIRGARGLLELRRERIEDLMRELEDLKQKLAGARGLLDFRARSLLELRRERIEESIELEETEA